MRNVISLVSKKCKNKLTFNILGNINVLQLTVSVVFTIFPLRLMTREMAALMGTPKHHVSNNESKYLVTDYNSIQYLSFSI